MIVSFSNKFIFIKTRKTAGTSAELVLSSWCSGNDVCTKITEADEVTRREMGCHPPVDEFNGVKVRNHMPASEVKALVPSEWPDFYKFTIERHPYEKVISGVYWNIGFRGGDPVGEFESELNKVLEEGTFIDRNRYMVDGEIALDEVILYDNLWVRLAALGVRWRKTVPDRLPQAKAAHRKDRRPAKEILTPAQKARIRQMADIEFSLFGFLP